MIKREKKLSIPTLNRLNEEDESIVENQDGNFNNNKYNNNSSGYNESLRVTSTEQTELAIEKKKLTQSIDGVFKLVPFCETPNVLDDNKRLESLEQLLINRLVLNYQGNDDSLSSNRNEYLINKLTSSQYGLYLASSFETNVISTSSQTTNENSESKEKTVNLNDLNLTSECLNRFSFKSLESKITSTKKAEMRNEDFANFVQNSKKIKILNLTNNSLKRLPIQLLSLFENLELINLSENNFESINLIGLVKFSSLKEINLSNNYLKSFKAAGLVTSNGDEDDEAKIDDRVQVISFFSS
jgi:hypothetical protein